MTVADSSRDRGGLGPDGALHGADHLQVPEGRAWGPLLPPGRKLRMDINKTLFSSPEFQHFSLCRCRRSALCWPVCNMTVVGYRACISERYFLSFPRRNLLWTHQRTASTRPRSCLSPSMFRGSTSLCRWETLSPPVCVWPKDSRCITWCSYRRICHLLL